MITSEASVPPIVFLVAVARDDPRCLEMAPNVDPIALALLAISVAEWPAVSDPQPWLERYLLADRQRALGEA